MSLTVDWDKIGFEKGFENQEFPHQANMINQLHQNEAFKKILGVESLYFTGSEIVFSREKEPRKKIDIVAHDGEGKVFFFEMKGAGKQR